MEDIFISQTTSKFGKILVRLSSLVDPLTSLSLCKLINKVPLRKERVSFEGESPLVGYKGCPRSYVHNYNGN